MYLSEPDSGDAGWGLSVIVAGVRIGLHLFEVGLYSLEVAYICRSKGWLVVH